MGAQRGNRVIVSRQFGLGQGGVNLAVADVMQQNGRPALAAFEFRDQMMQALGNARRDRAQAERADRSRSVGHAFGPEQSRSRMEYV